MLCSSDYDVGVLWMSGFVVIGYVILCYWWAAVLWVCYWLASVWILYRWVACRGKWFWVSLFVDERVCFGWMGMLSVSGYVIGKWLHCSELVCFWYIMGKWLCWGWVGILWMSSYITGERPMWVKGYVMDEWLCLGWVGTLWVSSCIMGE